MENPYKDAYELSAIKWMWKYHKRYMVFSFLFISMFVVFPHIGQWRIDDPVLRWSISCGAMALQFVASFLHPWKIYRKNLKGYHRWQKNYDSGMYDKKK